MTALHFADPATLDDLDVYVSRAHSANALGAIRLQASGMSLAAYVGLLPGRGVEAEGAVIGLRVMSLAEPAEIDATVWLVSVTDRLARRKGSARDAVLPVPPVTLEVEWAAVEPPRSGWEALGEVSTVELKAIALQGIEEIAQGAPPGAGPPAVMALREAVWGRQAPTRPPIMAGAAFGAHVLGFLRSAPSAQVYGAGRWTRLSTPAGHVLVR